MDPFRNPVFVPKYRSPFGGLWPDLGHAKTLADGKLRLGVITEEEHADLMSWIDDGYVVMPGAVDLDLIDALSAEIEDVWEKGHPNAWVNLIEDGVGYSRPLKPEDRLKPDNLVKLLDIYEFMESARRVIFAPRIQRFLEIIFERPVLAHQGLSFYRGSKQPIHRDTAFVKVSSPMELVASWVALEDVHPGSGELEYYKGSHTWPEFLFEGKYKWWPPGNEETDQFHRHLADCARQRKVAATRFLAKKGDVFIWSADLGHGGSPYTDETRTRRSLVTHYSPANTYPMYFHYVEHSDRVPWGKHSFYCYQKKVYWTSRPS
ncbi:MAG TPA: phytanoyl-CoA dioxygenase family protein [Candidatus Acidoferrum sp.]|nr:phytanoyl-CoA dioxygenase family protein [Candidatus Acidoferrum sp.]